MIVRGINDLDVLKTDHMYRGNQNMTIAKQDSSHTECINSYVCTYLNIMWTLKVLETVN